jgi:hydroxypyruvate isomerase
MKSSAPEMPRRQFLGTCAAGALGAASLPIPRVSFWRAEPAVPAATPLLSVMLWTIAPKQRFEQRIGLVADAGYHAVELVNEYEGWSAAEFSDARHQLHQRGMVVDACSGIDASLVDPSQRELLLRQIRAKLSVLAELECSRLILLSGNRVAALSHEQMHTNCLESLKRVAEITTSKNIEILLENIDPEENPQYFLTSVAEGFEIVREVNHPKVRFLYDFFHEQISEGNLIAKLEKNLDLVGLVHIADVPGRHAPGTGEINYATIFRKLGQRGYSQFIAMEFLPLGDPVSELRSAREFAEKYFAEGRQLAAGILLQESTPCLVS